MSVNNLLCLYCGRTAFAALNLEITAGRARYPVCTQPACMDLAFTNARAALDNAASKEQPDAIDVESHEVGQLAEGYVPQRLADEDYA